MSTAAPENAVTRWFADAFVHLHPLLQDLHRRRGTLRGISPAQSGPQFPQVPSHAASAEVRPWFESVAGKRIVRRKESLTRTIFHVERIDSCRRKRLGKNADERLFGGPTTFR
jgi:hypothetical protein